MPTKAAIPLTKSGNVPIFSRESLSPELLQLTEQIHCEKSFPHWLFEYGVVEVRNVGVVPLKDSIWPFQRSFAQLLVEKARLVILKARQVGVSTLVMQFAYWKIRFGKPNSQHVLVLSKTKDDASNVLMPKVLLAHNAQPDWMRMPIQSQNTHRFELANGNSISILAATEAGGRGFAGTVVILDEHAFHGAAEANWAALQPTLEGAGHFIVISTGNGIGNLFYDLYEKAKVGINTFTPVFINWSAPPHRDRDWLDAQQMDSPVAEDLFKQEYPATDLEAFVKSGTSPFDPAYVDERRKASVTVQPKRLFDGRGLVWAQRIVGQAYFAGLDLAGGLSRTGIPDQTSLTILDSYDRHVASWCGRMELGDALAEIYSILLMYNPFLVVERNGAGSGAISTLQTLGFERFYKFEQRHLFADASPEKNPLIGLQRTPSVKARQVSMLGAKINSRNLFSDDYGFWGEVATYVQKEPMKWGAQGKNHDDRVDSMMHALWAKANAPRAHARRAVKVRWR